MPAEGEAGTSDHRRVMFVTGASSGYGEAIVRRSVAGGDRVVAAARRSDRLDALVEELGDAVHPVVLDVRDRAAVDAAVARLPDGFDRIDVLVNNAGVAKGLEPAHLAEPEAWEVMIDTNCAGLVHCTRAILPAMVERGRGHVVNMGSIAGTYPYPGGNVYGATKAFVHQFSANLRSDLHGTGVRVTCIEPGMSSGTEFSLVRFGGDDGRAGAVYDGVQALTADDIADAVEWATTRSVHVNIDVIELMPVAQSPGALQVDRRG